MKSWDPQQKARHEVPYIQTGILVFYPALNERKNAEHANATQGEEKCDVGRRMGEIPEGRREVGEEPEENGEVWGQDEHSVEVDRRQRDEDERNSHFHEQDPCQRIRGEDHGNAQPRMQSLGEGDGPRVSSPFRADGRFPAEQSLSLDELHKLRNHQNFHRVVAPAQRRQRRPIHL